MHFKTMNKEKKHFLVICKQGNVRFNCQKAYAKMYLNNNSQSNRMPDPRLRPITVM